MLSVMISIQPFWCGEIASEKKNAEIRKTQPKVTESFKCYIYCTKDQRHKFWRSKGYTYVDDRSHNIFDRCGNGMVIGEFVCGGIIPLGNLTSYPWGLLHSDNHEFLKMVVTKCARLTEEMLRNYSKGRPCYAWEIEDLVIYDEPKSLADFGLQKAPQSWCYVKEVA